MNGVWGGEILGGNGGKGYGLRGKREEIPEGNETDMAHIRRKRFDVSNAEKESLVFFFGRWIRGK